MFDSIAVKRSRVTLRRPLLRLFSILLIISLLVLPAGALAASDNAAPSAPATSNKFVLFASDGMRPDLMEQYAAQGFMPTYAALMAAGVVENVADGIQRAAEIIDSGAAIKKLDELIAMSQNLAA